MVLRLWIVALELQDVADGRTTERVDRLVGVTDHAELPGWHVAIFWTDKFLDQRVLGVVGVLVLINQHVPEAAAVFFGDIREVPAASARPS